MSRAQHRAFPLPEDTETLAQRGMTIREYFAAAAMQGILANTATGYPPQKLAEMALMAADALITALEEVQ